MNIHIHIHHHGSHRADSDRILSLLNTIIMNEQELLDALNEANAKLTKIETEVKEKDAVQDSKIAALEQALENGNALSPEVVEALNALKSNLQKVDDINEDAAGTGEDPADVKDGIA